MSLFRPILHLFCTISYLAQLVDGIDNPPTQNDSGCKDGFNAHEGVHCFKYLNTSFKTWSEADLECHAQNASLPMVRSKTEVDHLLEFKRDVNPDDHDSIWLDAKKTSNSLEANWMDEAPDSLITWAEWRTNSSTNLNESCIIMNNDGLLEHRNCSNRYPVYCSRRACPNGYSLGGRFCYRKATNQYQFIQYQERTVHGDLLINFKMAQHKCSARIGRLPIFHNSENFNRFIYFFKPFGHYWLGLLALPQQNKWIWLDGSNDQWSNWESPDEPSNFSVKNCAVGQELKSDVSDVSCYDHYDAYCQANTRIDDSVHCPVMSVSPLAIVFVSNTQLVVGTHFYCYSKRKDETKLERESSVCQLNGEWNPGQICGGYYFPRSRRQNSNIFVLEASLEWTTAVSDCAERGASLLSIRSDDELADFKQLRSDDGFAWLDAKELDGSTETSWLDDAPDNPLQWSKWAPGSPNKVSGDCLAINAAGLLVDKPCKNKYSVYCIKRDCPNGYDRYNRFCYRNMRTEKDYKSARKLCSKNHGRLPVFHIAENYDNFIRWLSSSGITGLRQDPTWIWLDMIRTEDDKWQWLDGSKNSWTKWMKKSTHDDETDQPNNYGGNQDCVTLKLRSSDRNGFDDSVCSDKDVNVICQAHTIVKGVNYCPEFLGTGRGPMLSRTDYATGTLAWERCEKTFNSTSESKNAVVCRANGTWSSDGLSCHCTAKTCPCTLPPVLKYPVDCGNSHKLEFERKKEKTCFSLENEHLCDDSKNQIKKINFELETINLLKCKASSVFLNWLFPVFTLVLVL